MSRSATLQQAATTASTNTGVLLRKCSCGKASHGGTCDSCKDKEESLHRKASGASPSHEAPSIVHDVLRDQGQPLDAGTRTDMEQRFGHDFAQVRVHTGSRAAESAQAVSALAYTVGQHVVFGANQLSPTTTEGRHLLAHELAHTVQQRGTPERRQHRLIVRDHDSSEERAADRAADIALRGGTVSHAMPALATSHAVPGGAVQRKGGLLDPRTVDAVYLAWIQEIFKSRGINTMSDALEKEIREKVKKQVGPGNWANYEKWEQEEHEKRWAKAKAENPEPKPADSKPFDLVTAQIEQYNAMWEATQTLRAEVVRVEGLVSKLDFGSGIKGGLARGAVGGYTALYAVGARTASTVSEAVPMMALGAGGTMLGSSMAEDLLVKQGQNVKQAGEEMGDDVRTAVRVVGGDMQANYEATRPSYNRYWAALKTFGDHRSDFRNKHQELDGMTLAMARGPYIAGMTDAMKEMQEAGNEFLMKCALLGVESDAKALNKLGGNIVKGAEQAVEMAVTGVVPELAPGLREAKAALKGTKGMGAKQLEKEAADAVGGLAKKVDDVPLAGAAKPKTPAPKQADEAAKAAVPDPPKAATPDPPKAATPDPPKAAVPDPPRAAAPDPPKAVNAEPPKAAAPAPGKSPTTSGASQSPPPLAPAGKAKPKAKNGSTDTVTKETTEMFDRKPELNEALDASPRAAKALNKCQSPCFPEHMTGKQTRRLEKILEQAENAGLHWDEDALTNFLRSTKNKREMDDALKALAKDVKDKRGVAGEFGEAAAQIGGDRTTPRGRDATSVARNTPGKASGGDKLPDIADQWFPEVRVPGKRSVKGSKDIRIAQIPGQIARKLRKIGNFKSFEDFRKTFWKLVAQDPVLSKGWSKQNLAAMRKGSPPGAGRSHLGRSEQTGGGSNAVYNLDHKLSIENGGGVYDLDNIQVVSPRMHVEIGE